MRSQAVRMTDSSKVSEVRRLVVELTQQLGWDEEATAKAALLTTELATNAVKHATDGVLTINALAGIEAESSLQLVAVDQGPGITDVEQCFRDGFSTAGSPGTGLGAVRRLASVCDVFSTPGKGTAIYVEVRPTPTARFPNPRKTFSAGGVCIPRHGESLNGDAWTCEERGGRFYALAVDGLGHGMFAAQASAQALEAFRSRTEYGARETLIRIHESLRATRGAAAALAIIDRDAGKLTYCGIGNITGCTVVGGTIRHLVSHNGILGHALVRAAEFVYPWTDDSTLVLHSDGITSRWRPEQWPGLWLRAPSLVAGIVYRDCARGRDDSTVAIIRGPQ